MNLFKIGRVVTLIKGTESDRVYGIGYRIAPEKAKHVLEHLDYREKNGYERHETLLHPIDNENDTKKTIVYVANADNPSYNPDHDIHNIAKQVFHAVGPSGQNIEYVYKLCKAMREYFPNHYAEDTHIFELEKILQQMEKTKCC